MIEELWSYVNIWATTINSNYSVNPWIFIAIYLATLPFTWLLFFKIVFSLKERKGRITTLSLITAEILLLIAPYLYVLLSLDNVSFYLRALFVLIVLATIAILFRFLRNQENEWDKVARDYDAISRVSRAHQKKFATVTQLVFDENSSTLLDVGCGSGILEKWLDDKGFRGRILGIDSSREMLRIAKSRAYYKSSCSFVESDLNQPLPSDVSGYDVVCVINLLFCLKNQQFFLNDISKHLNASGRLILINPKPNPTTGQFFKEHFSGLGVIGWFKEIALLIYHSTRLLKVLLYQMKIDRIEKTKGGFDYKSEPEILNMLNIAGLKTEKVEDIQAGQNKIYICRKL